MRVAYEDFDKVEMLVGTILEAEDFPEARNPAYRIRIDFGNVRNFPQFITGS